MRVALCTPRTEATEPFLRAFWGESGDKQDDGKLSSFLSPHITGTGRLAARMGSGSTGKVCSLIAGLEEVLDVDRPSVLDQLAEGNMPRSARHPGRDLRWFSNPLANLHGVEQEKHKRTMVGYSVLVKFVISP